MRGRARRLCGGPAAGGQRPEARGAWKLCSGESEVPRVGGRDVVGSSRGRWAPSLGLGAAVGGGAVTPTPQVVLGDPAPPGAHPGCAQPLRRLHTYCVPGAVRSLRRDALDPPRSQGGRARSPAASAAAWTACRVCCGSWPGGGGTGASARARTAVLEYVVRPICPPAVYREPRARFGGLQESAVL